jgi:nitrogen regulatory protein PII
MKLITAVIAPFELAQVREQLSRLGVRGMTVTEVRGCGIGHSDVCRPADYAALYQPQLMLEVGVDDELVEATIHAMGKVAGSTALPSADAKVVIIPLEHAVRIRTGDMDDEAL